MTRASKPPSEAVIVDAVARILNEEQYYAGHAATLWAGLSDRERETYRVMARAALAFIEMSLKP